MVALHPRARRGLRQLAFTLMAVGGLLLMIGWFGPALLRAAFAMQRPFAFSVVGLGALLMWWASRAAALPASRRPADTTDAIRLLPLPPTQWHPSVFRAIEWRRFEALCEAMFAQDGFVTHSLPFGADGGVDIWLHDPADPERTRRAVQCKNWSRQPVGQTPIREFIGVLADAKVAAGVFICAGKFTPEATALAQRYQITPVDGAALLTLIGQRSPDQQRELLNVATDGEYWRPTCARCGTKMVERGAARDGAGFWGCAAFPQCRSVLQWRSEKT